MHPAGRSAFALRSVIARLLTTLQIGALHLALLCATAARGCGLLLHASLQWPPEPAVSPWLAQSRAQLLLRAQAMQTRRVAWPGIVVIYRLVTFLASLIVVLGDWQVNVVRVPAVIGLPGGSHVLLSLDVVTALLFLAMATLFGLLSLEFVDAVPCNLHLFPDLRPTIRRAFTVLALGGLGLSVLTVGLLYLAGAALLQETSLPPLLPLLINGLQGVLITLVAVPACFALVLGLVALLSVGAALLWVAFTSLMWLFVTLAGGPLERGDGGTPRLHLLGDEEDDQGDWPWT